MAKYDARITYATPTPGLAEVEPSMNWNPSVVAGIGVVRDPAELFQDMHSYLAGSGQPCLHPASWHVRPVKQLANTNWKPAILGM